MFATLPAPYPPAADGALAFDSVGRFGYRLLAATGRSGGLKPAGGVVYAIDPSGHVQQVGSYAGPGGADELVIAPRRFGSVAGDALLTVDAGPSGGAVVALDPSGRTRPIATFPLGPNPIAPIPKLPSSDRENSRSSSGPLRQRRQDGLHLHGAGGLARQIRGRCDRRHRVPPRPLLDPQAERQRFRRDTAARQPVRRDQPRAGDLRELKAAPSSHATLAASSNHSPFLGHRLHEVSSHGNRMKYAERVKDARKRESGFRT